MYPSASLRALTDPELFARLDALVAQERENSADIVNHLSELDRREKVLDRAYSSLFDYCRRRLGYSEQEAYLRIRAARAVGDFPEILERLRSGRLQLDSIARLYPHMNDENSRQLLEKVEGASKREVLALVAAFDPTPAPERDIVVPVPSAPSTSKPQESAAPEIIPTTTLRFHFTGDDELMRMVGKLRALLRHKYPDGRLESIFKEAAKQLLEMLERRRSLVKRRTQSTAGRVPPEARHGSRKVPRSVKAEVWSRDQGRCAFRAEDGTLCGSREALEYDHIVPWADGGRSDTPDNIRLLCRPHNQRLGRRRFGPRRRLC